MSSPEQRNPYPYLQFQPGVDWGDANLDLWRKLNQVGAALGKPLQVISGYRTPQHSVAVGGFANDPHTRGIAADVQLGGTPLGNVPGAMAAIAKVGLLSGNVPNFFNGKPDPGHVQLSSAAGGGSGGAATPDPSQAGGGAGDGGSPGASPVAASCLPATLALLGMFGGGLALLFHVL